MWIAKWNSEQEKAKHWLSSKAVELRRHSAYSNLPTFMQLKSVSKLLTLIAFNNRQSVV